jgi:DNA (cytosine-5)-methyltransferase 1
MGYHRAGWEVVGVDIAPQPHYPFPWYRAPWEIGLAELLPTVDAIHASPPCQAWSHLAGATRAEYPRLVDAVRAALEDTGRPYVIENVERAPLRNALTLCGTQFGLSIRRHRRFETSPALFDLIAPCWCRGRVANGELIGHRLGTETRGRTQPPHRTESERRAAMGVDWMTNREARQAVPPVYTEWIGSRLHRAVTESLVAYGHTAEAGSGLSGPPRGL